MLRHLLLAIFLSLLLQVYAQEAVEGGQKAPFDCKDRMVTVVKTTLHSYQMCLHMRRHKKEWENSNSQQDYLPEPLKNYSYQAIWQSCVCLGNARAELKKKSKAKSKAKSQAKGGKSQGIAAPKVVETQVITSTVHVDKPVTRMVDRASTLTVDNSVTQTITATATVTTSPKCYAPRDYCNIDHPGECCNEECKYSERNSMGDPIYRCA